MEPIIKSIPDKKLIGMHISTSLVNNVTGNLWRQFMPRRKEIKNNLNNTLVSMQLFDDSIDFTSDNKDIVFENWAAVEVSDFDDVPEGMESYVIKGGEYVTYRHKGDDALYYSNLQYIYKVWLPQSGYRLDAREHFEILDEKYKPNDPSSEEDVWIPVIK